MLDRIRAKPFEGAAKVNVIVPFRLLPPATVEALRAIENDTVGSISNSAAPDEFFKLALILAAASLVTAAVVILNVPDD